MSTGSGQADSVEPRRVQKSAKANWKIKAEWNEKKGIMPQPDVKLAEWVLNWEKQQRPKACLASYPKHLRGRNTASSTLHSRQKLVTGFPRESTPSTNIWIPATLFLHPLKQ